MEKEQNEAEAYYGQLPPHISPKNNLQDQEHNEQEVRNRLHSGSNEKVVIWEKATASLTAAILSCVAGIITWAIFFTASRQVDDILDDPNRFADYSAIQNDAASTALAGGIMALVFLVGSLFCSVLSVFLGDKTRKEYDKVSIQDKIPVKANRTPVQRGVASAGNILGFVQCCINLLLAFAVLSLLYDGISGNPT